MLVNVGFTGLVRLGMGVGMVMEGVAVAMRMGVHDDLPQALAAAAVKGADFSDTPALGAICGFVRFIGHLEPRFLYHPQAFAVLPVELPTP
jgi:hypothetical protein